MFVPADQVVREKLDWGTLAWFCRPAGTGMNKVVVIEATLSPGGGHAFHKHPRQEEVIYCIQGEVEQYLGEEKRTLTPGDAIVIPVDKVHATFNTGQVDAKMLAILGPAIDDENGYEVDEVADQEPWSGLR
jgi:quercetin dioxygenase-like cupin family protein